MISQIQVRNQSGVNYDIFLLHSAFILRCAEIYKYLAVTQACIIKGNDVESMAA